MLGRLSEDQIEDVLRTATIARIGCRDGDSVYVVPISFVYADGCVYGHSAEGRKLTLMRATPEVCFEVEDVRGPSDWRRYGISGAQWRGSQQEGRAGRRDR